MIYVTDGSFEGVLTAVFEAYKNKTEPEDIIVSKDGYQLSLLPAMEVASDSEKSARVEKAIVEKMGREALETIYRAYLSDSPDVGMAIYNFIKIGLKTGRRVLSYLQHPDILKVHDMSSRVLKETHLFLGILRFRKLKNGIYYSKIEPDGNIIAFLAEHFAARLSDQPWIIHDAKRGICALYNTIEVVFTDEPIHLKEDFQDEFETLWKRYFDTIAIESRKNLKLQRQFMPKRYWKNLIEKQNL
ncbi:MAG: DNA metabolism protein [Clostridiaceae bacterium]|nr:DNA metabolism protein [Clostridiaceae bacterium]